MTTKKSGFTKKQRDAIRAKFKKRGECKHSKYKGTEKHGFCCPSCGKTLTDFGN